MTTEKPSYYEFFGLENFESDHAKIKAAYRSMALKWHPDRHPDPKDKPNAEHMMKQVVEVYRVLSTCKNSYDNHLRSKSGAAQEGPFAKKEYTFRYSPFGANAGEAIFDFTDLEELMKRYSYGPKFEDAPKAKSESGQEQLGSIARRELRKKINAELWDLSYKELDQVVYFIKGLKMGRPTGS